MTDYNQSSDLELRAQVLMTLWQDRMSQAAFPDLPLITEYLEQLEPTDSENATAGKIILLNENILTCLPLVKQAIEERCECWSSAWIGKAAEQYCFAIHVTSDLIIDAYAETEERAACIAFLKAMEIERRSKDA